VCSTDGSDSGTILSLFLSEEDEAVIVLLSAATVASSCSFVVRPNLGHQDDDDADPDDADAAVWSSLPAAKFVTALELYSLTFEPELIVNPKVQG